MNKNRWTQFICKKTFEILFVRLIFEIHRDIFRMFMKQKRYEQSGELPLGRNYSQNTFFACSTIRFKWIIDSFLAK